MKVDIFLNVKLVSYKTYIAGWLYGTIDYDDNALNVLSCYFFWLCIDFWTFSRDLSFDFLEASLLWNSIIQIISKLIIKIVKLYLYWYIVHIKDDFALWLARKPCQN
jgi:hypothetical protein